MLKEENYLDELARGSEKAFHSLFTAYYPSLLSFASTFISDREISEDIVQETFAKIWENRKSSTKITNLTAYLYQTVRNRCLNHLRAVKVRQEAISVFQEETPVEESHHYLREETYRLVFNSLNNLPPACREVFLRTINGFSAKEIAEELSISVETVKKQKQNARRILKEELGHLYLIFIYRVPPFCF